MEDRRTIGGAVGGISLFGGGRDVAELSRRRADGASWAGWNAIEANAASRWTKGYAELPLKGMKEGQMGLLSIQVQNAGPFVVAPPARAETAMLRA